MRRIQPSTKPKTRARSAITGRFMRMADAIRDKWCSIIERIRVARK